MDQIGMFLSSNIDTIYADTSGLFLAILGKAWNSYEKYTDVGNTNLM